MQHGLRAAAPPQPPQPPGNAPLGTHHACLPPMHSSQRPPPTRDARGRLEASPAIHQQQPLLVQHLDGACDKFRWKSGGRRGGIGGEKRGVGSASRSARCSSHCPRLAPVQPRFPPSLTTAACISLRPPAAMRPARSHHSSQRCFPITHLQTAARRIPAPCCSPAQTPCWSPRFQSRPANPTRTCRRQS